MVVNTVFLLEHVSTSAGTWNAVTDLTDAFLLIPVHKDHRNNLLSAGEASTTHLWFYIKEY